VPNSRLAALAQDIDPDGIPSEALARRGFVPPAFNRNAASPDGRQKKEGRFAPRVSGFSFLLELISCR
jgi:hypothetical protein